jgi:uncharacterized protein YndB with AHSA1/START domain
MAAKVKKYDWTQFTEKIEIAASPQRVFKAWTSEKEIVKWFLTEAKLEPKKGGRFFMKFLTGVSSEETILAIKKDQSFTFSFGADDETVTVTIKKTKSGCDCILWQFGMKDTPQARINWHMGCRNGWVFFLTNLKAYLEYKIDLRLTG